MRWEKLSQSCQTIIAWIFLVFVVGTFLALIIMKVTTEGECIPFSAHHQCFSRSSFPYAFSLCSTFLPSLPPSSSLHFWWPILFPLHMSHTHTHTHTHTLSSLSTCHTHTWCVDSGSSQLSFKTWRLTWWHCGWQSLCVYLSTWSEHNQILQQNSLSNPSGQPQWMVSDKSQVVRQL